MNLKSYLLVLVQTLALVAAVSLIAPHTSPSLPAIPAQPLPTTPGDSVLRLNCFLLIPASTTPTLCPDKLPVFETLVYDSDGNGVFSTGDLIIVQGSHPPVAGDVLKNDPNIKFRDGESVPDHIWQAATPEPIFYDTGTPANRVFLLGSPTASATNIQLTGGTSCTPGTNCDPKIRFIDTDNNGVFSGGVLRITGRLENLGGILADGSQEDVDAIQIIYGYDITTLKAMRTTYPTGAVLPDKGSYASLVDSACRNSGTGASPLDSVVVDESAGTVSSSSACFQGPPRDGDVGIGCDPTYVDPVYPSSVCVGDGTPLTPGVQIVNIDAFNMQFLVLKNSPFTLPLDPTSGIHDIDVATDVQLPAQFFEGGNHPFACFTSTPESPRSGDTVTFDGSCTTDPDPAPKGQGNLAYSWVFGDGGTSTASPTATHAYTCAGPLSCSFTAKLTVTDTNTLSNTATQTITVLPAARHVTGTVVDCSSPVDVGSPSTCTATVTDNDASPTPPGGTVSFGTSGPGTFIGSPCTLGGTGASTSCMVTYTPSAVGTGTHTITGSYSGDTTHATSSGHTTVTVTVPLHTTTTSVSCSPSTVVVNQASHCTVTVTDTNTSPTTPMGSVSFTSDSIFFSFSSSGSCMLAAGTTAGTAVCSVDYTPGTGGPTSSPQHVTASYPGDSSHSMSSSTGFSITVNFRSATVSVACLPNSVNAGQSSTCTATVTDTAPGNPDLGLGFDVTFHTNGVGTFSSNTGTPNVCTVTSSTSTGTCSVSYTPTTVGTGTHTISAVMSAGSTGRNVYNPTPGSFDLTVTPPPGHTTTTDVTCDTPVFVNQDSTCTAKVTDTSSSPTTPMGMVSFNPNPLGSFSSNTCTLSGTTSSASCHVTYTPVQFGSGTHQITANYQGDPSHATSMGQFSIVVMKRTVTVTVSCLPDTVSVGQSTDCTVTVTDTSLGTPNLAGQTVGFTSTGAGTFSSSGQCTLTGTGAMASCHISYTPTAVGSGTHTITGTFNASGYLETNGTFPLMVTPALDQPPVASFTFTPTNPASGDTVHFDGSSSHDPDGSIDSYSWDFGDQSAAGSGAMPTHIYTCTTTPSCNFDVKLTVTDNAGLTNSTTKTVTVTAAPPPVHSTSTSVQCLPASVNVSTATTCTATVTDTSSTGAVSPGGNVMFQTDSSGTFSSSGSCSLSPSTSTASTCHVNYTPTAVGSGTHTVTANYQGESSHSTSSGHITVTVTSPPPPTGEIDLTFQCYDCDQFENGVGELNVLLNGQLVVDIPAGVNHLTGTGSVAAFEETWVSFGPFPINSQINQGTNTLVFLNPLTSHESRVRQVKVFQGSTIFLFQPRVRFIDPDHKVTYTFSNPPLRLASFTATPNPAVEFQQVTFTATFTGGVGPFTCKFDFGDDSDARVSTTTQSCSVTHTYEDDDEFDASVRITGANLSDRISGSLIVNVLEEPGGGDPPDPTDASTPIMADQTAPWLNNDPD